MNLSPYEPWTLFNLLHRDLDRLAGRQPRGGEAGDEAAAISDWLPPVDIVEEKDRFVLRADVPGVNPDDIEISMENGLLSIAGRRHEETADTTEGVRRVERVSGRFYRRFALPETADADQVEAKCSHGILEVTIPKQAQVMARRIAVRSD